MTNDQAPMTNKPRKTPFIGHWAPSIGPRLWEKGVIGHFSLRAKRLFFNTYTAFSLAAFF